MINKAKSQKPETKICLTVAGLDPSGGAGIIADVKTFTAFGCFAAAAVSSITFQNTTGVFGAAHQTAATVRAQIEPVLRDYEISALKTGMLPTREIIEEVADLVRENDLKNLVVDPVVRSTSGFDLIDDAALRALIEKLFPLAAVITPNIPEAERITRTKIESPEDVRRAAKQMQSYGAQAVLIKGGHMPILDFGLPISDLSAQKAESRKPETSKRQIVDFLFIGEQEITFSADFIETTATHGTGCTLAAAITANLALGKSLPEAVGIAKSFVTEAIRTAPLIGKGHSPINIARF